MGTPSQREPSRGHRRSRSRPSVSIRCPTRRESSAEAVVESWVEAPELADSSVPRGEGLEAFDEIAAAAAVAAAVVAVESRVDALAVESVARAAAQEAVAAGCNVGNTAAAG